MKPKNIVFTGMMGCGKTTAGKMVAQLNQMQFLDLDQMIEQRWGSIPSLFERGEAYFRAVESEAVSEVSEMEGLVIATGGGVVKNLENITALKKKGIIFFIDRPIEDILTDIDLSTRPLLKEGKNRLIQLFHERYPLYVKTCDIHLKDAKHLEDTVQKVIELWSIISGNQLNQVPE